jgi:hypothetical protein
LEATSLTFSLSIPDGRCVQQYEDDDNDQAEHGQASQSLNYL